MAKNYAKVEAKNFHRWRALLQYFIIYFILYPFFKIFYRVEVHGRENIPDGESIIIAANHISYFDPTIVSLAVTKPIAYMAKEELFHIPVFSSIIQTLGAFAVNRAKLEIATIRSAKAILSTDWHLCIFPEGTRIKTGKIGKINKGFGYLAKSTKTRILPLGIVGSNTCCGKLIVKIGKPLPVPEDPEKVADSWGKAISELTGLKYEKQDSIADEEKI